MREWFRRQQPEEETRFGHVVLQHVFHGAAYSLGLYETPDVMGHELAFRGSFLRPVGRYSTRDLSSGELIDWDREPLPSVPIGVELTADADAFATWRTMAAAVPPERTEEGLHIFNPETEEGYEVYWEVSPPFGYPGRTVWSGRLGRTGPEYNFVLEQYGTIEVTTLLLALVFWVGHPVDAALQTWLCHRRATEQCGEGNIKLCEFNHAITGSTLHAEGGCRIECFHPRERPPKEAE